MRLTAIVFVLSLCVLDTFAGKVFFDTEKDVFFKLYKRENPTNFTILNQNSSQNSFPLDSFDPEIPTRICIHGYLASSGTIDQFREAFLDAGEFNFIVSPTRNTNPLIPFIILIESIRSLILFNYSINFKYNFSWLIGRVEHSM